MAAGSLYLCLEDGDTHRLSCGDALLLPRGQQHALASAPGVPLRPVDSYETTTLCSNVCRLSDCPEDTCRSADALIFSGRMRFDLDGLVLAFTVSATMAAAKYSQ